MRESKKGGIKGEAKRGKSGKREDRGLKGKEVGIMREKGVGGKGPERILTNSDFWYPYDCGLSVLKRCVPKTLAFAFGLRLRSKTRGFKTRVLKRRLPNGKSQERLRFRDLRSKTLAFKKRIAIVFCDLKTSLGARACVQVLCVQKTRRFAFAFLNPLT